LLRRQPFAVDNGPHASLAFSLQANRPGALLEALGCFASEGLNMSRIESRPSKRSMGEYIFFVDLDLTQGMAPLDRALAALRPHCEQLVLFGVYPLTVLNPPEESNNAANN
jgi:prephenate dehydratase